VDNGSSDDTWRLLNAAMGVRVFRTSQSYSKADYGVSWLKILLRRYGMNCWCLVVDADEFFAYPACEILTIPYVCKALEAERSTALMCLLLDLYGKEPISQTEIIPNQSPMDTCCYFDTDSIISVRPHYDQTSERMMRLGGMRLRLFGIKPNLDKVSLFFYNKGVQIYPGMHRLSGVRYSRAEGVILHPKYSADFVSRVSNEVARKEHWNSAVEYRAYHGEMANAPSLSAFKLGSVKYISSGQLIRLGLMKWSCSLRLLYVCRLCRLPHGR
jgi:hypothetical protein